MPRTIYTKIGHILDTTQRTNATDRATLAKEVRDRRLISFQVVAIDTEGNRRTKQCKTSTIEKTIRIAEDLDLVSCQNDGCLLTERGKNVVNNYNAGLGQSVIDCLERNHGLELTMIEDACRNIKTTNSSFCPSAVLLIEELERNPNVTLTNPLNPKQFSLFAILLARTGLFRSHIVKFYWPA